jgi:uncharacterized protein YkwD
MPTDKGMLTRLAVIAAAFMAVTATQPAVAAAAHTPARKVLVRRINHVRARHGLRPVRASRIVHSAAIRHSDDMMSRNYFSHTSPTGSTMVDRIQKTGYVSGYSWVAGETLAWGWGTHKGARATVKAWMHSPEHRAILLSPKYRVIGAARACGTYLGYPGACVWTADWVTRW